MTKEIAARPAAQSRNHPAQQVRQTELTRLGVLPACKQSPCGIRVLLLSFSAMRLPNPLPAVVLTALVMMTGGCINPWFPCPTGRLEGDLSVQGNRLIWSAGSDARDLGPTDGDTLHGCKELTGRLYIQDELSSVAALDPFEVVRGSVFIGPITGMTVFDGLPNLRTIGGELSIATNQPSLRELRGFGQLEEIGDRLIIHGEAPDTSSLKVIESFPRLRSLGGELKCLTSNLRELRGFASLELLTSIELVGCSSFEAISIAGVAHIDGDLAVRSGSSALLMELPSLQTIGRHMSLTSVHDIQAARLGSIAGGVAILGSLRTLTGLQAVRTIGGSLVVTDNYYLDDAEIQQWVANIEVGGMVTICRNQGRTLCPSGAQP